MSALPPAELARAAEQIVAQGFAVIHDVLTDVEVDRATRALDEVLDRERDIAPTRAWLTDQYHVSYALPVKHPVFLDLCTHPRLVPASHRHPVDPDDLAGLEPMAQVVEMPAGAVVAFDGSLVHAGSANTTDHPRRALHAFYGRRWVKPHWDFPAMLPAAVADGLDDVRRDLLGYTSRPARLDLERSTIEWH